MKIDCNSKQNFDCHRLYNSSKSLIKVYFKLLWITFYYPYYYEANYITIDVLFYLMDLFSFKSLVAWFHLTSTNKLSYFVFIELIQFFFYYFCLLSSIKPLYSLSLNLWLFYIKLCYK